MSDPAPRADRPTGKDFLRTIVERDLAEGKFQQIVTRFPPEPNGYLHIGHAMAICLDFGIADEYGGRTHLRFDDTNPLKEDPEFAEAIKNDVRWLGFEWDALYYAADYFEQLYEHAETLIRKGKAYVDSQNEQEIREGRGSLTEPGRNSPYRDRSVEENLDLFRRMRAGEFPDGSHVLRGKIDMAHPNMIMRDPVFYRIRHVPHYRAGDAWCIYPLYDYAHCLEDAIEGVTHSFCTLEFDNNREIYDWILDEVGYEEPRTHQYEFAGLNLEGTVLSKRRILPLIRAGVLSGWDDPRVFTLAGQRRRGVPAGAIRQFVDMIGVTRNEGRTDMGKLEFAIRDYLNTQAPRVMAVLDPLEVEISNYAEGREEELEASYYPRDVPLEGTRPVPFSGHLFIERTDFALDPPEGWRRLAPGWEVRLRHAYTLRCDAVEKDPVTGEVIRLVCSYDPDTLGTNPDRPVKGVIHWVSAPHSVEAEVRLYDRLFTSDPSTLPEDADLAPLLNESSLDVVERARIEPSVLSDDPGTRYQFERTGYFWRDPVDGAGERLVFNRIVTLRDTWGKRTEVSTEAAGKSTTEARIDKAPPPPPAQPASPTDRISDERRAARAASPELASRFERYQDELGLSVDDADLLTADLVTAELFEGAYAAAGSASAVASWITNDVLREMKDREVDGVAGLALDPGRLGRLVAMVEGGRINRSGGRTVLAELIGGTEEPEAIVERLGLEVVDDPTALRELIASVMGEWPGKVEEYRGGKTGLLGFFVGKVMAATGGAADPRLTKELLSEALEGANP